MNAKTIEQLLKDQPESVRNLVTPLHDVAISHNCQCRVDTAGDGVHIVYSARSFSVHITGEQVSFSGGYDIRAFMNLYHHTDDQTAKKLMFDAAIVCEYCIDDKCTTLLMPEQRTITLDGHRKKLCAPWRHHLHINVTDDELTACRAIAAMMFEYTYQHMHTDLFTQNEVTYKLTEMGVFYIVGYKAVHNQFTMSDEQFAASLLQSDMNGRRKIDEVLEATGQADNGNYVGATDNFTNGVLYDYIFGVMCEFAPNELPEGMVCRKLRYGSWAVYNSSSDDYKSIWRHFTDHFYEAEKMGYDTARIPFECYDSAGRLSDVHIPVDPEMGRDSAKTWVLVHTPNMKMAGFTNYVENDHPLHNEYAFGLSSKLKELFPYADKHINTSIHAFFGKPMQCMNGVEIDDLTPIPDGVETYELRGGYWHVEGRRHFNGGSCGWNFDSFYDSLLTRDTLAHPRAFNEYEYRARGGYSEIVAPVRVRGEQTFELVELVPQTVIGILEAPPHSVVTDAEKLAFYDLQANSDRGSYMIGYTLTKANNMLFYDKPLVKGVLANMDAVIPDGCQPYTLQGGRFMKITESLPLGEPGWEIEWVNSPDFGIKTGHEPDFSRQFIIRQYGYGSSYEFYVPVE